MEAAFWLEGDEKFGGDSFVKLYGESESRMLWERDEELRLYGWLAIVHILVAASALSTRIMVKQDSARSSVLLVTDIFNLTQRQCTGFNCIYMVSCLYVLLSCLFALYPARSSFRKINADCKLLSEA